MLNVRGVWMVRVWDRSCVTRTMPGAFGGRMMRVWDPSCVRMTTLGAIRGRMMCGIFLHQDDNAGGHSRTDDADLKAWPKSIKRTRKRFTAPQYVIPGHFGWEGDGLQHTLELLEQ
ncbi:hypothetical protein [Flavobacterium sp.]|uniref:hypothetical protein n=1 Tax=Flavobacterium sp. TaxID=239 RepID=UPI002623E233|nr:hypothetical protein [Flavobacterium sp.]